MKTEKTSRLNLKMALVYFALIPLTVGIITLGIVSYNILTQTIEDDIKEELTIASSGLREYYEYNLVYDYNLTDGFLTYNPEEYIDKIAGST